MSLARSWAPAPAGARTAQAEMLPQLTAIAAASNLLTTVAGFYFTLFLSLPLCSWLYGKLEPVLGRDDDSTWTNRRGA